jgi:hypothetical protein
MIICPACGASVVVKDGVEQSHSSRCYMDGTVLLQERDDDVPAD